MPGTLVFIADYQSRHKCRVSHGNDGHFQFIRNTHTHPDHTYRVHYRMLSFPRRREMDGSMEVAIKCISTVPVTVMDVKWTGISRTNNNEMVSAGDTEISLHIRAP